MKRTCLSVAQSDQLVDCPMWVGLFSIPSFWVVWRGLGYVTREVEEVVFAVVSVPHYPMNAD